MGISEAKKEPVAKIKLPKAPKIDEIDMISEEAEGGSFDDAFDDVPLVKEKAPKKAKKEVE
jgi:hypothetical protein